MKSVFKSLKYTAVFVISVLILSLSFSVFAEDSSYKPENGIVKIYSGLSDMNEDFYRIKSCSGFVVSNTESGCYIITTYKGIKISSKEKKSCMSDNGLGKDNYGVNETVKVVVNGDVEATLTTVNKSKKENFVILQSESVINEKKELKLGNSVEKEETVSSLGFSDNKGSYIRYEIDDVTKNKGEVESPTVELSHGTYISHSASFDSGCSGGPLVNADGYVVGLNDSSVTTDGYYALSIESIKRILDNYSIAYSSYDYDQNYAQYTKLYDKCKALCESGNYSSESVQNLLTVLDDVKSQVKDNPSDENVTAAIKTLKNAKSKLVKNTPTIRIVIFILLGVLIILLIWLVFLLFKNYRNSHPRKKDKTSKKQKKKLKNNQQNSSSVPQPEQRQFYSAVSNRVNKKEAFVRKLDSAEAMKIDKKIFTLGSKTDEVDFAVDNKAVSRKHATIKYIDNKYYIFDENSVNGTYVNDVMVEDEGKLLNNNDIIALANEQLLFEERTFSGGER